MNGTTTPGATAAASWVLLVDITPPLHLHLIIQHGEEDQHYAHHQTSSLSFLQDDAGTGTLSTSTLFLSSSWKKEDITSS